MSRLLDAAGDAPFVFVAGKGGTGKTTTAGALSLELADAGTPTHLISTDPAHSLSDLFGHPVGGTPVRSECSPGLLIEEFDAKRAADEWLAGAIGDVTEIIERGTYLDAEDVAAFSRLALPGLDEMMAVIRLSDLARNAPGEGRVVVDTAPTGHTIRLLDAADTHESIARALRAMAAKADAVAGAFAGRAVRMRGEDIIDRLEDYVRAYREQVLDPAAIVIATRAGVVVEAETERLAQELKRRHLRIAAFVTTGVTASTGTTGTGNDEAAHAAGDGPGAARLTVPLLPDVRGCDGLRRWRDHVQSGRNRTSGPGPAGAVGHGRTPGPGPAAHTAPGGTRESGQAAAWLEEHAPRLLLFAGKGGVGKSTCAAAAALALAASRDVLLCSTDPAGSLTDVLATAAPRPAARLRVMQIDPGAQFRKLRDAYRDDVAAALEGIGLSGSAALDRRVIESLWDLAPPGLDELAGTAALLSAADPAETLIIDSAPTGHFLRLLEMPEVALGWTRQLMRVIVKYGIAGVAGGAAQSLIALSRELKALHDVLRDEASAAVMVVTLDEPLVHAEAGRLITALGAARVAVRGVIINRVNRVASTGAMALPALIHTGVLFHAPAIDPAPVGPDALRGFIDGWKIVA